MSHLLNLHPAFFYWFSSGERVASLAMTIVSGAFLGLGWFRLDKAMKEQRLDLRVRKDVLCLLVAYGFLILSHEVLPYEERFPINGTSVSARASTPEQRPSPERP